MFREVSATWMSIMIPYGDNSESALYVTVFKTVEIYAVWCQFVEVFCAILGITKEQSFQNNTTICC